MLTRIAGLFAARGYNIESLAVGATETPGVSRMTIVVDVEDKPLEQVTKQLNKLINVIKILEHDQGSAVERELMLVKVRSEGDNRARIMEIADVFRVNVVDVTSGTLTLEAAGKPEKLEALLVAAARLRDRRAVAHRPDRARPRRPRHQGPHAQGREQRLSVRTQPRTRKESDEMATIYYEKDTDPGALQRAEDRGARLRFAGPRARPEPAGQRVRRAGRAPAGLREPRQGGGGRASACSTPPTRWPRPTWSCACCPTPRTGRSTRRTSRRTSRTATC